MDPETVKAVAARSQGRCEYPGCNARSYLELHHRQLRRHGRHDPDNLVALCGPHHRYVQQHPKESYENGLMVHSWADPSEVAW